MGNGAERGFFIVFQEFCCYCTFFPYMTQNTLRQGARKIPGAIAGVLGFKKMKEETLHILYILMTLGRNFNTNMEKI